MFTTEEILEQLETFRNMLAYDVMYLKGKNEDKRQQTLNILTEFNDLLEEIGVEL